MKPIEVLIKIFNLGSVDKKESGAILNFFPALIIHILSSVESVDLEGT